MTDACVDLASAIPENVPLGLHCGYGYLGAGRLREPELSLVVACQPRPLGASGAALTYVTSAYATPTCLSSARGATSTSADKRRVPRLDDHPHEALKRQPRVDARKKYLNDFGIARSVVWSRNPRELGNILITS